jgi:hypothetical protein
MLATGRDDGDKRQPSAGNRSLGPKANEAACWSEQVTGGGC